jgi:hypothetical protein
MEQVIAVDPGGHTGVIRFNCDGGTGADARFDVHQEPWEKAIDLIQLWLETGKREGWSTTIVVERYTITMQTLKKTRQYEALYCIGGLLVFARMYGCEIVLQHPGEAKALVTDDRLRTLGWYDPVKGKEHARDALRHLVRWLVQTKRMDPGQLLGLDV